MLTVEKLKAMQPGEIFAQGEGIDDGKIFNIWGEGWHVQWVAVRGKGYHDRAIYYHLSNEEERDKAETDADFYYCCKWNWQAIADVGDKLTRESTIKALVPCDEETFNLYIMNKKPKKNKPEKVQTYLAFYEPMLNLEIRLYRGDEGEKEYENYLYDVSGRFLDTGEAGNTITEPIEAGDGGYFRAMRVRSKGYNRYLIHEMYHMVNAIKDAYDLGEEGGAYLMGWLAEEIYLKIDK